jgi:hypothetical protein
MTAGAEVIHEVGALGPFTCSVADSATAHATSARPW